MNLKPVFGERDLTRLRGLYDGAETHFRGLQAMGVDDGSYSCIDVPCLLEKLPKSIRISLVRAAFCPEDWLFADFLRALQKVLDIRESYAPLVAKPKSENSRGWTEKEDMPPMQ